MKRHLSLSLVVALIALLIAVGGPAAAAVSKLITGKQIKDGSIGLVDLSVKAKQVLRGQAGAQGPTGPQGPVGSPGPAGLNGGFDPAKVVYVEGSRASASIGNVRSSVASCPSGTKVVSGGYNVISYRGPFQVLESRARDAAGWYVTMYPDPTFGSSVDFYATAVCAAP
jgi:hypothetical protein